MVSYIHTIHAIFYNLFDTSPEFLQLTELLKFFDPKEVWSQLQMQELKKRGFLMKVSKRSENYIVDSNVEVRFE